MIENQEKFQGFTGGKIENMVIFAPCL